MKPQMHYSVINQGHSVGQELEYFLIKEGKPYDFINMFIQELKITLPLLNRKRNSAKAYQDAWQLELCSAPHVNISDLYEEMKGLYETMYDKAKDKGLKVIKSSSYKFEHLTNRYEFSGSHVHIGYSFLIKNKLLDAIIPYLPIFVALANNSPTENFPKGSQRLREGTCGNNLDRKNRKKSSSAIFKHKVAPTIEIRCLDRSKTLEEDIANVAFVFATAEKIKDEVKFLDSQLKIMRKTFSRLYLENEKIPKAQNYKDILTILTGILIQRAASNGFDSDVSFQFNDYRPKKTLGEITKQHYLKIQGKLEEIKTPKHLIQILDEKILGL